MNTTKISIYQVLPRLFDNKCEHCIPHGDIKSNGVGKLTAFTSKALQAIKSLGVTHIWYTGLIEHATQSSFRGIISDHPAIVKGVAGSPYAIKDYYDISPTLATSVVRRMDEFQHLVEKTHKEGLGFIMDFVPNHIARSYKSDRAPLGTEDFGSQDDPSTHFSSQNNFYYLPHTTLTIKTEERQYTETPARATGNDCFTSSPTPNDWYETVKLNYGIDYLGGHRPHFTPRPDTWEKMLDILLYWASKGVDGFRCDMAEMVPIEFWEWCISEVHLRYPHIIFIAEIYQPHLYQSYIGAGFDYLYDKVGLYDALIGILKGKRPSSDITKVYFSQEGLHGRMLRFMENHDEQRLASDFVIGSGHQAFPAMVVATLLGTTDGILTYFGQELGERGMDSEGFSGLDGRTSIFDYWSLDTMRRWIGPRNTYSDKYLTAEESSLRQLYTRLLNTTLDSPALHSGKFFDLMYANPQVCHQHDYLFLRSDGVETFLISVNFSDAPHRYDVHIPSLAFEVLGLRDKSPVIIEEIFTHTRGALLLSSDESIPISVPPHGASIYRMK